MNRVFRGWCILFLLVTVRSADEGWWWMIVSHSAQLCVNMFPAILSWLTSLDQITVIKSSCYYCACTDWKMTESIVLCVVCQRSTRWGWWVEKTSAGKGVKRKFFSLLLFLLFAETIMKYPILFPVVKGGFHDNTYTENVCCCAIKLISKQACWLSKYYKVPC